MIGRIRTVKPEFPHSESMGRVSRDARLCFLQLFTMADDEGRLRASPRSLVGLLYPYDEDAVELLPGWLSELEREGCIQRYDVRGSNYITITNWSRHQRIDKPKPSSLPGPDENKKVVSDDLDGGREGGLEASLTDNEPRQKSRDTSRHVATGADGAQETSRRLSPGPAEPRDASRTFPPRARVLDLDRDLERDLDKDRDGDLDLKASASLRSAGRDLEDSVASPGPSSGGPEEARSRTWSSYASAYKVCYGIAPVRNAKANSLIKQFVERIGQDDASQVAAWFVQHPNEWYLKKGHSLECLVADAEMLRTEWATGRQITTKEARDADAREGRASKYRSVVEELRREDEAEAAGRSEL